MLKSQFINLKSPDSAPEIKSLPQRIPYGADAAPAAPAKLADLGIDPAIVSDLALKAAYTVPQFNTEWMARQLHLPQALIGEILEQLRVHQLLEVLGQAGPFGFRYSVSQKGRERASRLLEISGYIGPAPVSLDAYTALLDWQYDRFTPVTPERVSTAMQKLVFPQETAHLAGLAISSGRSLFLFGPAGNGKTSLGRALHSALQGELWIPRCIALESNIIRIYDDQVHEVVNLPAEDVWRVDQRWVRIQRPFIVLGGEATLDSFELTYSPSLRFYESPMHMKANGGTLLIDDFGRQKVDPHLLLNRWIIPLEHQYDYLSLQTGQKIQVPFRQMLIIATNLSPDDVTDPAFLRRMGYRLYIDHPSHDLYGRIFTNFAEQNGLSVSEGLLDHLFRRYNQEQRPLRSCEPRDLIQRVQDICRFANRTPELTEEYLDLAWTGYFGVQTTRPA